MSSNKKQEFDLRLKYLKDIGVEKINQVQEYRGEPPNRKSYNLNIFESILLPLTPEQWISICMSEGNSYIGGCCGNTSVIQDKINSIFRFDSGWLKISKLSKISELMINHDECDKPDNTINFQFLPKGKNLEQTVKLCHGLLAKKEMLDPWQVIALIWHITKDFYKPDVPFVHGEHIAPLETSISILSRGLHTLNIDHLFKIGNKSSFQDKINKALTLVKLLPALKTVNEQIETIYSGPLEGYAIVDKEKNQKVCINGLGYCIFSSMKEIDKLFDLWESNDKEFEDEKTINKVLAREKFSVRKVRVSKENGIEFLDS